ncbi:hypothetical protein [Fusobacterium polymorphum]|uniref:hypothetical protein n=1 Tax=Fusobacterium nucleatum subsp. polymorphum TaxID=76857 RepID=UPI00164D8B1F|nr:hypothetical protein [Fusobacterium polymorphum]
MFESLLYGAVGIFLIMCAIILMLKSLGETCLGCLATVFWLVVIIWIFKKCST